MRRAALARCANGEGASRKMFDVEMGEKHEQQSREREAKEKQYTISRPRNTRTTRESSVVGERKEKSIFVVVDAVPGLSN